MGHALEVKDLVKWYGKEVLALDHVSFEVDEGDFVVIMGPSGCGKSTLLKCITGILHWDEGDIFIREKSMKGVPAYKRNIALMPERYSLFPHMRVYDNVAFGLRMRGEDESEIKKKVSDALKMVGLEGFEKRWPSELSGGQRQRVAVARAIVVNPAILLLDEPLSHVDYRLQRKMMDDFRKLQSELGNTWLLTSHVQEHGLSMARTLIVMSNAVIEQIGTSDEIYNHPKTVFTARFVGEINLLDGTVVSQKKKECVVKTELGELIGTYTGESDLKGQRIAYGVRPDKIKIVQNSDAFDNKVNAELVSYYFFGEIIEFLFKTKEKIELKVRTEPIRCELGSTYTLAWNAGDANILDKPSMAKGVKIEDIIYGR
ncbi:MAG: ABC transporter ATP-binding protein [Candidatus Bathyarchaeia archaeon]